MNDYECTMTESCVSHPFYLKKYIYIDIFIGIVLYLFYIDTKSGAKINNQAKIMGCGTRIIKKAKKRKKTDRRSSSISTSPTLLIPRIPQKCDNCGAAIDGNNLKWAGPTSIMCQYCDAILNVQMEKIS